MGDSLMVKQDVLDEASLPPRAEVGLPGDRIVYSCSNQLYKYDPETFSTWCTPVPHPILPETFISTLSLPAGRA